MALSKAGRQKILLGAVAGAVATLAIGQMWELLKLTWTLDWSKIGALLLKNPEAQASLVPFFLQWILIFLYARRFRITSDSTDALWKIMNLGYVAGYLGVLALHLMSGNAAPILAELQESKIGIPFAFLCAVVYLAAKLAETILTGDGSERRVQTVKKNRSKKRG